MERRYFVSFMNKKDGQLRYSFRIVNLSEGIFNMRDVIDFLKAENKCSEIVILFFKELKKYELGGDVREKRDKNAKTR